MQLIDKLQQKKMKIQEIPKWGYYLRKQWELHYVHHLSTEEKEAIYLFNERYASGFLWHVFSYEKRDHLKEEKAVAAFNQQIKGSCYLFYQHSDDAMILQSANRMKAEDILEEEDIYIVDKDFKWTYVKTHEAGYYGPYFSRK
ncbi:DUF4275 family protein [Cytobacillus purgationiresistens]|uniref:DUF4275 family protein n=1 Tax=Cytobacillus purgationiresistens TaxID=863449 RepID=A0ABU0AK90_9BACI|nr:DUF4275 family protein [Cytobacillus purgationiresistens]MDQ0271681.1 hypothetical protein [Cytobacillus purgationiresistens]